MSKNILLNAKAILNSPKKAIMVLLICFVSSSAIAFGIFSGYSLSADEIYRKVQKSIYTIESGDYRGGAVAISENILVTNCHLLTHNKWITLNDEILLLQIINSEYKYLDVCFIYASNINLHPIKVRASSSVKIGETTYAIGNPKGHLKTISGGLISNKEIENGFTRLQTDAAISHGSSGGGLFDENANLIGITTKFDSKGNLISFAAPTDPILKVLDKQGSFNITTLKEDSAAFNEMMDIIREHPKDDRLNMIIDLEVCANKKNPHCRLFLGEMYFEDAKYTQAYPLLYGNTGKAGGEQIGFSVLCIKTGLG